MAAVAMPTRPSTSPLSSACTAALFGSRYWADRVQCALSMDPNSRSVVRCNVTPTSNKRKRDCGSGSKVNETNKRRKSGERFFKGYEKSKVSMLRQSVVDRLEMRVETALDNGRNNKNINRVAFARGLERVLYLKAATFEEHVDESTLDQRLSSLAKDLATRKRQANSNSTATKTARSSQQRQQHARILLQQAQELKFSFHQSKSCGQPVPYKLKLPEPVKHFYFHTRLFYTPITPSITDDILEEAQHNMEAYRIWAEHKLPCSLPQHPPLEQCSSKDQD